MGRPSIFNIGLRIFLLIITLFLIEETFRFWISLTLSRQADVNSVERGLVLNPADAELNFHLAEIYHMLAFADESKAENLYVKSVELNPLFPSSWLGLTDVFVENGEKQKALSTLGRLSELTPLSSSYLWEGAILALRLGDRQMAIEDLRLVAKTDPHKRWDAFDLAREAIGDPQLILDKVVPDEALPDYLWYLISKDKLDDTFPVWKRMKEVGVTSNWAVLRYIEFLSAKDRVSDASSIWDGVFGKRGDSLVWNGGFERDLLGGGFDWIIWSFVPGVKIDFDEEKRFEGERSLRVRFDGKHNVDFYHVWEIVPVEPNANYTLTSYMSTQDITTSNGITWEIYCYPKINMVKTMEPLTGTNDWRRVEVSFHTPSDCKSIVVRLRRYASTKFDRYISGTAWVDDVKLFKVESKADAQSG